MEIERKFLVDKTKINLDGHSSYDIIQGYLSKNIDLTIRVRIENDKGYITIKGPTKNISREEFEYEIPIEDVHQLIKLCDKTISKKRFFVDYKEKVWEIDVFSGDNDGLIVAEIELNSENESFEVPDWAIREVSDDSRYYNARLIDNPYKLWK